MLNSLDVSNLLPGVVIGSSVKLKFHNTFKILCSSINTKTKLIIYSRAI